MEQARSVEETPAGVHSSGRKARQLSLIAFVLVGPTIELRDCYGALLDVWLDATDPPE